MNQNERVTDDQLANMLSLTKGPFTGSSWTKALLELQLRRQYDARLGMVFNVETGNSHCLASVIWKTADKAASEATAIERASAKPEPNCTGWTAYTHSGEVLCHLPPGLPAVGDIVTYDGFGEAVEATGKVPQSKQKSDDQSLPRGGFF